LFVSYVILSLAISRKVIPIYTPLGKIVDELNSLSNSINWIEQKDFTAPLLQTIQGLLNNRKAATSIRAVKNILDRFDYRLNPLIFIPLNAFLLWDLQQVLKLEKWKQHHQHVVKDWFSALSQMESLCSLANVAFNHPNWVFPKFSNQPGLLWITDAGHPLIEQEKRVTNSFKTATTPALALVTGSNMAGKSTFLRTVGINTVLALAGAPVCATAFTLYPMHIISSMRVADNLEENTSTFYAELKKLRHIIEVVNRKENVFLLLDEILRGTNSLDRHTGSKALIRQLIQQQACAVIATHDLELAKLTEQYNDSITNYHFDVQVSGEELYFDYRLKEGVCNSLNASILMKKIGIELNDNTTLGHL
jgi:DNA mismatch repair ATPase MutS